jgi:hypothetical protein
MDATPDDLVAAKDAWLVYRARLQASPVLAGVRAAEAWATDRGMQLPTPNPLLKVIFLDGYLIGQAAQRAADAVQKDGT